MDVDIRVMEILSKWIDKQRVAYYYISIFGYANMQIRGESD